MLIVASIFEPRIFMHKKIPIIDQYKFWDGGFSSQYEIIKKEDVYFIVHQEVMVFLFASNLSKVYNNSQYSSLIQDHSFVAKLHTKDDNKS